VVAHNHVNKNKLKEKISRYLKHTLSKYKIPKHIFFLKKIPRTATGKVHRKEILNQLSKIAAGERYA
jgi:acyl-coenzyme A synthetase/AMP-(fatty) acid ligase